MSSTFSALFVGVILLVIVLMPGVAAADTGTDDHEHEETAIGTQPSSLSRLLENRVIYLVGSILLMAILTWGVFLIVGVRKPISPPPNNQAP